MTDKPETEFNHMYDHRYGGYRLIVPPLLMACVLFLLSYFVADTAISLAFAIGSFPHLAEQGQA